jgi:hypothetical protein
MIKSTSSNVSGGTRPQPAGPLPGGTDFDAKLDSCNHRRAQNPVEKSKSELGQVQEQAYNLDVEHVTNYKAISALSSLTHKYPSSKLLGLISPLLKRHEAAFQARYAADLKLPFSNDMLVVFKRELRSNRANVKDDNKLFKAVVDAIREVPNSRYRDEVLDILGPVAKRRNSPIPSQANKRAFER